MTANSDTHFWVVLDTDSGPRFFSRFQSHYPRTEWITTGARDRAYCFGTEQDARRVVDQLRKVGRRARIAAERLSPPPDPDVPMPPPDLRSWVKKIIDAGPGRGSGKADAERINAGYRALSRQFHPDHGGKHADMLKLNAAAKWMRQNLL